MSKLHNVLVSAIIPTYNGRNKIITCLNGLATQSRKPDEVIVVIDGSTDDTKEVLTKYSGFPVLKIIEKENRGRATSRNVGASNANGNLFIFFDDDIRASNNVIERHIEFHSTHSNSLASGQILEDPTLSTSDIFQFKAHLSKKWTSKYKEGINKLKLNDLFLTAANFSIRKTDFYSLGGFNEKLSDAEDFELGFRALQSGFDIYFDKDNIAWHDDVITCKKYIARQRQYNKAHQDLAKIIIDIDKGFQKRSLKINLFKRLVFSFFSHSFWVKMIDSELLTFLPKFVRYQLYDWVITGLGKVYPNNRID